MLSHEAGGFLWRKSPAEVSSLAGSLKTASLSGFIYEAVDTLFHGMQGDKQEPRPSDLNAGSPAGSLKPGQELFSMKRGRRLFCGRPH